MKQQRFKAKTLAIAIGVFSGLNTGISHATEAPPAQPIAKIGHCPSGYSTSSGYCVPGSHARYAIEKRGGCPSGYSTSGDYCLAGSYAKLAMHKNGGCPSGWATSNGYCLSAR